MGKSEEVLSKEELTGSILNRGKSLLIEEFFDKNTMSVHLKENYFAQAKRGSPGSWRLEDVSKHKLTRDDIKSAVDEIIEEAQSRDDGFVEIEREGSVIVQLANFRIVIARPPLADGWEITIVRPIKKLTLQDYSLTEKLEARIKEKAEGILISGAPGEGKSTFVQSLASYYASKNRIVKTIEAPRDLVLPSNITRYSISKGKQNEIQDILLLARPDYTLFDEMRNTEDFKLFSDLRLCGVGMVGVIHATNPVDAISRFIGRIELGIIPHVIDTVIFVRGGKVERAFDISLEVKVPFGMVEKDLARPIVMVKDFDTGNFEFEIYSYGDDTVVVPVNKGEKNAKASPLRKIAAEKVCEFLRKYSNDVKAELLDDFTAKILVPQKDVARIIGKNRETIGKIEEDIGLRIEVEGIKAQKEEKTKENSSHAVKFQVGFSEKCIQLIVGEDYVEKLIEIYVNDEFLVSTKVGKKGLIKVRTDSDVGKEIQEAIKKGKIRLVAV